MSWWATFPNLKLFKLQTPQTRTTERGTQNVFLFSQILPTQRNDIFIHMSIVDGIAYVQIVQIEILQQGIKILRLIVNPYIQLVRC